MRPQVGKGAREYKPPKEIPKTKARLFVEAKMKHNLSMREDYLSMRDVAAAMNLNALEQRMITKQKILKMIEKGLPKDQLNPVPLPVVKSDGFNMIKSVERPGKANRRILASGK